MTLTTFDRAGAAMAIADIDWAAKYIDWAAKYSTMPNAVEPAAFAGRALLAKEPPCLALGCNAGSVLA